MHFTSLDIRDVTEAPFERRDEADIVRQPAREDVVLLRRASLDGKRPILHSATGLPKHEANPRIGDSTST